ncbi:PHA-granule associated protein 4 [Cupriavidus oxalaticus]|uniref:PHA-granule associated protein 4 n=1 Tax=Cupriavidus oxalaticus TaxID=96344 RepID=UPI004033C46B
MNRLIVRSKAEAMQILQSHRSIEIELDYADAWRDTAEIGRLGLRFDVRVVSRGIDHIQVVSLAALRAGLCRPKATYRQRNFYCTFRLSLVPKEQVQRILRLVAMAGDRLFDGALWVGEPHERWA